MTSVRSLSTSVCAICRYSLQVRPFSSTPYRGLGKLGGRRASREQLRLPDSPARTRFAPSPTGYLHLGSLRTALYNYLLAKATRGQFLIRVEDTDRTRLVPDAEDRLYADLKWSGLTWDEAPDVGGDYGPYRQSERLSIYRAHVQQLLDDGKAYRCFCTAETLDFQKQQRGEVHKKTGYPGTCLSVSAAESDRRAGAGEPHVVRFKSAEAAVMAPDLVYGQFKNGEPEDDFIIMKSDGFPTYHFANVVDDHLMKITHVVRGAEWLISTPKHVDLYNAFGWTPPSFAHVGLLVDSDRQKLSKRNLDDIGISRYRESGILPEALLNYAAFMGWNADLQHNPDMNQQGVLTLADLEKHFTMRFTKGDIGIEPQRLVTLQKEHLNMTIKQATEASGPVLTLIKPIADALFRWQNKQVEYLENELEQVVDRAEFPPEETRFLNSIEQRIAKTSGPDLLVEHSVEEVYEYILQALKICSTRTTDPEHFIHSNRYLFWTPPRHVIARAIPELSRSKTDMSASRISNGSTWPHVMNRLTNILDRVKVRQWDKEHVTVAVQKFIDEECTAANNLDRTKGWELLRHILLGDMSGPPVVPMMLLLGRQEVLYRLRNPRHLAQKLDSRPVEVRRSMQTNDFVASERRPTKTRTARAGRGAA